MAFGVIRNLREHSLVAHDRKRPWLLIDGAWRMDGGVDQLADQLLVDLVAH
jgi:hypothetical protein